MESRRPFPHPAVLAVLVLAAIAVAATFALADASKFTQEGGSIVGLAWGRATLADLAAGLLLATLWIHYREKSLGRALLWTVAVLALGNLATLIYVVRAAVLSQGDPVRFFTGRAVEDSGNGLTTA